MRHRLRCPTLSSSSSYVSPNSNSSSNFKYSAWKSLFMRQHHIETNWRLRPVRQPRVLKGHDDHVITCLQFDDERIVSGSDDNTLKVGSKFEKGTVCACSWQNFGPFFQVWSAVTGKCLRTLVGHTGGVWSSQMEGKTCRTFVNTRIKKLNDFFIPRQHHSERKHRPHAEGVGRRPG